jgi:soluble lytic murein transglycosylase
MRFAFRLFCAAGILLALSPVSFARPNPQATSATRIVPVSKQIERLSRALKHKDSSSAYAQLSAIASRESSGIPGMRAALALGYLDYSKGDYAQAAKWLDLARGDSLLADYSLYWSAETDLARGHSADALAEFKHFRMAFPDSVITDQALQSLGEAALASGQPAEAVAALDTYSSTTARPALLFLRAEAHELAGQPLDAVADYQALYMRFAISEQAREARSKLEFLRSRLGEGFPALSLEQRLAHAAILYYAKEWGGARDEYAEALPQLQVSSDRERAELRILECGLALGADPSETAALPITDPDVDAERFYSLAAHYRGQQQEEQMVAAVESAASRAPSSGWAESAFFLAGNYYWVNLDRDRASGYYKRVADQFPTAPDANPAQWRVTWTAVLKREADAAELLQEHLRRFPGSIYSPDALYWLGRLAEESGVPGLARSYYEKLVERYPQNYFEGLAIPHLRALAPGPSANIGVLATIPPVPPVLKLTNTIPATAMRRKVRADALRAIAFDASAELELRAAYAATGEPRLLLEAAQAAVDADHFGAAIVTLRQIYPQLESRRLLDVPRPVWLAAYALPFGSSIRRWSVRSGLDPMLVAGLIRQESAFEPEARSGANALGLMQLLPQTARRLAKQGRIRYSQPLLFDPDYNVRLGTIYVAELQKQFGNIESVLAAYNAGEDRVVSWTESQTYREPAEFVESIPFTETRQYVELVTRNADIYRRLYGAGNESRKIRTRSGH